MRAMKKQLLRLCIIYAVIAAVLAGAFLTVRSNRRTAYNVAINRIHEQITKAVSRGDDPDEFIAESLSVWSDSFGKRCPTEIVFIEAEDRQNFLTYSDTTICGIYGSDGSLTGMVRYRHGGFEEHAVFFIIAAVLISLAVTATMMLLVEHKILKPFRELADYPERLARMHTNEKLPETKNRYFGKYVWGMNMLCDVLDSDRRRISRLEADRNTLLTSLAHGIKTPSANIKLYAQAVKMGMYKAEDFAEIADKIEKNTEKLEKLTVEMLETSAAAVSAYEPEIEQFYLHELVDMIESEFSNRLRTMRIPYSIDIGFDIIITSDKWALFRAIAQIIENAMKYGNGGRITVSAFTDDDTVCISVRNKGKLLPESELSHVFKSYWRGSNSDGVEGSGIGLYTAKEVLKTLGGSIFARRLEDSGEMEFVVCFEIYE